MSLRSIIGLLFAGIIGVITLGVIGGSFYTVDEGEKAVILRNGAVTGIATPGFHWKAPFLDSAVDISLRDETITFDEVKAYTKDSQTATVHRISITYRAKPGNDDVLAIYSRYGSVKNAVSQMVTRRVSESLETVFGQFTADTAIKEREKLGQEFSKRIRNIDGPVEILSAQIENFSLPDSYERNIDAKMKAEVAEKQAEIDNRTAVANANAAATVKRTEADASAHAVRVQGEAEAAALRAKNDAIKESPNLIELTKAQQWDGKLPTTFVPGSAVPFLNLPSN
ncbi:prohibitin family protein [Xanthomonas campestris pv. campestris]|uniref:prohibitin family protein n=1 Tax=Xanthomonas campestris TaxID=339 RepID=UPI001F244476|nr:prohibitin family protein [Xanthomonas campestris]MCF8861637.1 prohibitin family protein [Xanthomonas campestris pv. campestris]